jgi:hypothetical protein
VSFVLREDVMPISNPCNVFFLFCWDISLTNKIADKHGYFFCEISLPVNLVLRTINIVANLLHHTKLPFLTRAY